MTTASPVDASQELEEINYTMPGGTLSGVSGGIMYRETYFDVNVKEIGLKCISMYILLCKSIMYIYLLPKYNSLYDEVFFCLY